MTIEQVAGTAVPVPATPRRQVTARTRRRRRWGKWSALFWVGPTIVLIAAVVVYPAVEMVRTSMETISSIGLDEGFAGAQNFRDLFAEPSLGHVVVNTVIWVVLVVGATVLISLPLAQLLNKRFVGRRVVRWALIVPWAASLVMTATLWRYIYEGGYGMLDRVFLDLGIIHSSVYWYQDTATAFWCLVAVGVIVSIPFTTYVFLAGLQAIPDDLYEAAQVDGSTAWQAYRRVTLPLLKPALVVAIVLNTIYVFNSFPIIWVITGKNPGFATDTTITFMYKLAFTYRLDPGEAAALGVLNVAFLVIVVGFYVSRARFGILGSEAPRAANVKKRWWSQARQALGETTGRALESVARLLGPARRALTAPLRAPGRALHRGWRPARPWVLPVIGALVAAFFLAPYAVMFLSSIKSTIDLFHVPALYLPTHPEWGNFIRVWSQIPLAAYLVNSLVIAGLSTLLVLLVSLPAAYYTARNSFFGRKAFLYLILVTQMFAPVALVVGIYREVESVNGMNSYWAIILIDAGFALAFSTWIMNGYLSSIPVEIEDAAKVDGAGPLRVMTRVVLPLARPAIVTAVIFTFIQVWNEFVVAETIFDNPTNNRETLTVGINAFVGLYQTQYNYLFVASLIGIVPVVILFAAIERHLVSGLTAGSVK
ncbi:MAG TPA: ABC transporter permease subunit [Acidimicrobiales bacterium]|nr:ABC transporter permease subunit [Acidimicrobiales bacterium]